MEGKDKEAMGLESEHLIDGKYSIRDLVDLERLRQIFERFSEATGSTVGFISYPDQEILISTGWRDVCTKFHRTNPESSKCCLKSNVAMTDKLKKEGDINIELCDNGLVDGGTPIIIQGKHVATLATGQVFFKEPDIERFRKQAETYGYDVEKYLEALREVPVVTEEEFTATLSFLGDIALLITGLGYDRLEAMEKSAKLQEEMKDRGKADDALERERNLLSTVINAIPTFVYFKDTESRFITANNATAEVMGAKTPQDLIGKTDRDYYPPEMAEKFFSDEREIIRTGKPLLNIEEQIRASSGETKWLLTSKVPTYDKSGRITGIVGVGRDITERRQAEEALVISEESYRAIFNTANDAIFILDIETAQIVDVNDKACEMYIYPKEEILRLSIHDLSLGEPPYTQNDLLGLIDKASRGEAQLFEWVAKDKAQRLFWVEVNLKRAVIGGKYRILAIVRDITERKQSEERWTKIHETFLSFGADPDENISRLTALCGELLGADCALYNRLEEGMLRSCGQWNCPADFIPVDKAEGHICYDVIKKKTDSVVVIRSLQETEYAQSDPGVTKYNLQTYVGRAVKVGGSYVGSLCVVYQHDFDPTEEDKEIVGFIALAIGVEEERRSAEEMSQIAHFAIEHSADPIFWISPDSRILYVNDITCKALDYSRDELLGMTISDIDPNFPKEAWPAHWQELKERRSFSFETKHRRKDGTIIPVEMTVNYLEFQGDEYNFAFARDITQRKKQEEDLLRRDYQLEILSRTSQHINAVLDVPVILRTLVTAAIELVDATAGTAGLMADGKMFFREYNRDGKAIPIDYAFKPGEGMCACLATAHKTYICNDAEKDPHITPEMRKAFDLYNLINVPIISREGDLIGCLEIHNKKDHRAFDAQDVFMLQGLAASAAIALENATALRQRDDAKKALEWQKSYYETLLDEANVWIEAVDKDGRLLLWNKKAEEITGYKRADLLDNFKKWELLYSDPAYRNKIMRFTKKLVAAGKTIKDLETEVVISTGEKRTVSWSSNIIRDSYGKIMGSMFIGADVTGSKFAEKEREALNREIVTTNRRLKQLALKDSQTGLYNHHYLNEVLEPEFYRAKRYGHPFSIIMIDIDYFKSVNDLYGHEFGDLVLKQFATHLRKLVRKYDIIIRYGGEEFLVLSPASDRTKAFAMSQRLLESINMYSFGDKKHVIKLKLSVAVAAYPDDTIAKGMDLVDLADKIIAKVKEDGGNTVYTSADIKKPKRLFLEGADIKFLKEKIARLTRRGKQSLIESIFAFAKTIEMRDHYTGKHAESTVRYSTEIGRALNISREEIEHLKQAAVLHDLGKVGISDKILHKKSKLSTKEYDEIKRHPQIAADIIRPIQFMHDIIPLILYHHERWDGKGYPAGLKSEEIPLGARIISIADVYQALTSDRPYRKAFSKKQAMKILKDGAGTQFDPVIVKVFLDILKKENHSPSSRRG